MGAARQIVSLSCDLAHHHRSALLRFLHFFSEFSLYTFELPSSFDEKIHFHEACIPFLERRQWRALPRPPLVFLVVIQPLNVLRDSAEAARRPTS
jgi:hypothetical protein